LVFVNYFTCEEFAQNALTPLYQGKITEVGTPDEIKSSSNAIVQQFIQGKAEGPITLDEAQI